MNATIIKQVWHGSWEMRLIMFATVVAGLTANDISPYILWMPVMIQGFVASYWNLIVLAVVAWLRAQKTSSKLVMFEKDATPEAEVIAAKATLKVITPAQAEAAAATLKAFNDSQTAKLSPKV